MSRSIKIWSGTSWEDVGPALPSVNTQFIQLTNPASTGVTIRAAASQSANIFQVQNYAVTPLFTIDASGNVAVNRSSANARSSVSGQYFTIGGSGPAGGVLELVNTSTDATGNYGTIVFGADGNTPSSNKSIAQVEAFTSGTTANNRGGTLIISTKADGGPSSERLRIDNNGNITIGNNLTVGGTTTLNGTISGTFSVGTVVQNADFNTLITSGIYRVNNNNTNGPQTSGANDWGQVFVMRSAADTITQIYGDYTTGNLWTRSGNPTSIGGAGTWTSWHRIIDSYGGSLTTAQPTTTGTLRNIYTSTSGASGGNDGDVWLVYV
jgi:hypothetical protein